MRTLRYPNAIATRSPSEARSVAPPLTKTIPFDYVFQFELNGVPHNKVQDVVEISMQGVFVAVSMGYSVLPKEATTVTPEIDGSTAPQGPVLVPLFESGILFGGGAERLKGILVAGTPGAEFAVLNFAKLSPTAPGDVVEDLLDLTKSPPQPAKTATLGSNGTAEIQFQPPILSGIIRVWDRTNNLLSQLIEIGSQSTPVVGPNPTALRLPAARNTTAHIYGRSGQVVSAFLLESSTGAVSKVDNKNTAGRKSWGCL